MLDRFLDSPFGRQVATTCDRRFLGQLPPSVRLVVMLGLGRKLNYVEACRMVWEEARPGAWHQVNDVAYADGAITVVHTEHFRVQGRHLPDWLGHSDHPRARLGLLARAAVQAALTTAPKGTPGAAPRVGAT